MKAKYPTRTRVLLVEDDNWTTAVLRSKLMMELDNIAVCIVSRWKKVIPKFSRFKPHIIISTMKLEEDEIPDVAVRIYRIIQNMRSSPQLIVGSSDDPGLGVPFFNSKKEGYTDKVVGKVRKILNKGLFDF